MNFHVTRKDLRVRQAVLGFSGWPDAGRTVQATLAHIMDHLAPDPVAVLDMDGFWHTESTRPQVAIHQGQVQRLDWPAWQFLLCTPPSSEPYLVGGGPEPQCQWRRFSREILQLLKNFGCQEIILLGSLFDQVLHDEAVISCVVQDTPGFNRARELNCQMVEYMGEAAIHSAIMEAAQLLDIHCLSFWGHVPFYLDGPHERVVARLLEILGRLLNMEFDTTVLWENWKKREREIEESLQQDHDLHHLVESLKREDRSSRSASFSPKVVRLDEFVRKKPRPPPDRE